MGRGEDEMWECAICERASAGVVGVDMGRREDVMWECAMCECASAGVVGVEMEVVRGRDRGGLMRRRPNNREAAISRLRTSLLSGCTSIST